MTAVDFDPTLSDEQRAIQATFHRFAEREIRPAARDLDERPRFPRELFARAGELGFFAMRYPEPHGRGADMLSFVVAVEELAWGSLAVAAACTMQALMGTHFVHALAPAAVRERLLPAAIRGERVGTICMTEPDAGSDLGAVATRAVERDGLWLLSGRKTWITSAPAADFFTVVARTGADALGFFLLEKGAPGLEVGRSIDKIGVRASLTSEVVFDATPATCRLGGPGDGMERLKQILSPIRLVTAALAVGVARAAFEDALAWARERRQFGRPIGEFQAVQAHLADMAADLEAARRLTRWAAACCDHGRPSSRDAALAKLFASEAALRVCDRAARVLASWGFAAESSVGRYLRDVRFTLIGGGTSEILRGVIGRAL